MSVNKYKPNLLLLPEDDAMRQIANGFLLNPAININCIQVLPIAGGWQKVVGNMASDLSNRMSSFPLTHIVGLIDCDGDSTRIKEARTQFPSLYADRVFLLGIDSEAENLRSALSLSFEQIGKGLARDCSSNSNDLWNHALLSANATEIERLRARMSPFLLKQ